MVGGQQALIIEAVKGEWRIGGVENWGSGELGEWRIEEGKGKLKFRLCIERDRNNGASVCACST